MEESQNKDKEQRDSIIRNVERGDGVTVTECLAASPLLVGELAITWMA